MNKLWIVSHTYNFNTQEPRAEGSQVQDQPVLDSKIEGSLDYIVRPCLEITKQNKK
jgi:hypothetical protein